jgi:integrase
VLIEDVDRYLKVRRALGYRLEGTEGHLRSFARFAAERGESRVASQTAIAWAQLGPSEGQRARRLRTVTQLARFLRAEDERHELPPTGVFCAQRHRPAPYIFGDDEIRRLLQEAGRLGPSGSLRPHTYKTLFGLLAVTGMRIGEALALRIEDCTCDGLVIRETKFQKDRLLPLHETSGAALLRYLARRRHISGSDDHLFVSLHRKKLCYASVIRTFRELCVAARIPRQPGISKVRLHDLRHTHAVRVLEACPDDRERVTRHMLALTTYMGHASISSTYWYLESTPQLMTDVANRCESFANGGAR